MSETPTVIATLFMPPRGERKQIEIKKVNQEDAEYINTNNIKVSLEELMTGDTAIYFDDGHFIDDDPSEDPDEIIIISKGGKKSCEECFAEGVQNLKYRVLSHQGAVA